jgi:hypothetical protein
LSTKLFITIVLQRITLTDFIVAHSKHIEVNRIHVIAHNCKCVRTYFWLIPLQKAHGLKSKGEI